MSDFNNFNFKTVLKIQFYDSLFALVCSVMELRTVFGVMFQN